MQNATNVRELIVPIRPSRRIRRGVADHANGHVVECYLEYLERRWKAGSLSELHLTACRADLRAFMAYLPADSDLPVGELRISESCNDDMESYLLDRPWRNATRKRHRSEIVTCFDWAAREGGLIEKSPFFRSRAFRLPVVPRREADREEYVRLMASAKRPLKLALLMMSRSARTCEMREATWPDIDWDTRTIELFENKTKRATGMSLLIGMDPLLFRVLRRRFERDWNKTGHICLNNRAAPWTANSFCQHLRRTLQKLGMDPGPGKRVTGYMFRHLWSGNAEANGCSDREIATGLGHSSTALVHWYSKARNRKAHQRAIAEKAARRR